MKKIKLIVFLLMLVSRMNAQLDSVKQELYKINKVFDSSRYIGFNINIRYISDTVYGKFEFDEMEGTYILNDKNIYYRMGEIEYMQNDSFAYDIYNDEKLLVMTRDTISARSDLFPLRNFVDSMLSWYSSSYMISFNSVGDSRVIEFNTTDSSLPYRRFAIYYEPTNYYPDRFEMSFIEKVQTDAIDAVVPARKTVVMTFKDYFNPSNPEIFEDSNYVFYDRERGKYRPSDKYRLYRFMTNGLDRQEDETIERFPADGN